MKVACMSIVFAGAAIVLFSIYRYIRLLIQHRAESHEKRIFSRWTYTLCMILMLLFFFGFIATGILFLLADAIGALDLLISIIFFLGSIFVWVVITVQSQMSVTISDQSGEIILTLVNAMEAKDGYTRGHSEQVSSLVWLFYGRLPEKLKRQVSFSHLIDAAMLHDIGKIGINDSVLNKPDKLSEDEWDLIRLHPRMGKHILAQTSFSKLGNIILAHHERMDGKGYYKIPGDQIALEARIIAIADAFSALYSDRVYRSRMSFHEAMSILQDEAGSHFDKELVDIFTAISQSEIDKAIQNTIEKM